MVENPTTGDYTEHNEYGDSSRYGRYGGEIMTFAYSADPRSFKSLIVGLCFIGMWCANPAMTQESGQGSPDGATGLSTGPGIAVDPEEEIEEITVVGPRSLVLIERQIERADFAMYEISNSLIDDPLYKTYCHRETSAGSNIKRRVCAAGYERELMSEAWEEERAMGRMGEGAYSFNYRLPEAELRKYRENMKQKMIELAAENPDLSAAIYKRAQLQRDYEAERKRRQQEDR